LVGGWGGGGWGVVEKGISKWYNEKKR
jgi:hypothetical protein